MIDTYFSGLLQVLHKFPNIQSSTVKTKRYGAKQGYISGFIQFETGSRLEFVEVKDMDRSSKVKYRYQYMDRHDACLFRYDNAHHHLDVSSFPHHKHERESISASHEPTLHDVLLEIAEYERGNANGK